MMSASQLWSYKQRIQHVLPYAGFCVCLWLEPLLIHSIIDAKASSLLFDADVYRSLGSVRDLFWILAEPQYQRLSESDDDSFALYFFSSIITSITWYVMLPILVFKRKSYSLLWRSYLTLILSLVLNTIFRVPQPAGALAAVVGDTWSVYAVSPVVLPAHAVVVPRLGLSWVIQWVWVEDFLSRNRDARRTGMVLVLLVAISCSILGMLVVCMHAAHGPQILLSVALSTSTFTPVTYVVALVDVIYTYLCVNQAVQAHRLEVDISDDEEDDAQGKPRTAGLEVQQQTMQPSHSLVDHLKNPEIGMDDVEFDTQHSLP